MLPEALQTSQCNLQDLNVPPARLFFFFFEYACPACSAWHPYRRCVKVDILTLGIINLPPILASDTPHINNIPVMPLFDLLVMKTHGWWHHRKSPRKHFQATVKAEVVDVDSLLNYAEEEGVEYEDERAVCRHKCEFMEWALVLTRRFVRKHRGGVNGGPIGFPL